MFAFHTRFIEIYLQCPTLVKTCYKAFVHQLLKALLSQVSESMVPYMYVLVASFLQSQVVQTSNFGSFSNQFLFLVKYLRAFALKLIALGTLTRLWKALVQ